MPTNEIKKDAREGKGSVPGLEHKWDSAKDASKKSTGKDDDWALTNYIYQKERDASVLNAAARLTGTEVTASAEDAIREAINAVPHQTIGKPFPVVTQFNGVQVPFMAFISRIANSAEQARGLYTKVILTTVKWGTLMKGGPKCWISDQYELTQKNKLVQAKALPKEMSEHEAEQFFHTCGVPVPPHHQ